MVSWSFSYPDPFLSDEKSKALGNPTTGSQNLATTSPERMLFIMSAWLFDGSHSRFLYTGLPVLWTKTTSVEFENRLWEYLYLQTLKTNIGKYRTDSYRSYLSGFWDCFGCFRVLWELPLTLVSRRNDKVGNFADSDTRKSLLFSHRSHVCFWYVIEEISGNLWLEFEENRTNFSCRKDHLNIEIPQPGDDLWFESDQTTTNPTPNRSIFYCYYVSRSANQIT